LLRAVLTAPPNASGSILDARAVSRNLAEWQMTGWPGSARRSSPGRAPPGGNPLRRFDCGICARMATRRRPEAPDLSQKVDFTFWSDALADLSSSLEPTS
jgi:hypothetical protein